VATSFILVSASGLANRQKSLCRNNLPRRHQHDRLSISGEGEGTASTSQSCGEVSTAHGLPSSAYSPEARGRSGRKLGTLQDRTAKDLALAGSPASRPPMISSSRSLSAAAQCPVRHAGRRGERLRGRWFGASRRDPVHRGGAGHGPPATIRLRMAIAGCTCPPVQREPTTSRRGSRSANIRTARSRCSMARDGSSTIAPRGWS
jgi:hypothetical protein